MSNIKTVSDAQYKAHLDAVKPFQAAIDLVTLAQACNLFDWETNYTDIKHRDAGKYTRAEISNGMKTLVQEILARHGIKVDWEKDVFGKTDAFLLPTTDAEKSQLLVSMRAIKMEGGKNSPTNLVMQLAKYMPQSQK